VEFSINGIWNAKSVMRKSEKEAVRKTVA